MYHMAYTYFVVCAAEAMIAWVIFPVYAMFAPLSNEKEDAVRFLHSSGISPIIVIIVSTMLLLLIIFKAKRERIFHVFVRIVKQARDGNGDEDTYLSNKSIGMLTIAALIAILIMVLPELSTSMKRPIVSLNIKKEIPGTEIQKMFDIQKEKEYEFQIRVDVEGLVADVRILNYQGQPMYQMFCHQTSASGTIEMKPGTYILSVSCLTDAAMFESYCNKMNYYLDDEDMGGYIAAYEQEAKLSKLLFEIR